MIDPKNFVQTVGLTGTGSIEIRIFLPNPFEITSQERKVVFAIVDAVREFEAYCASRPKEAA